MVNLQQLIDDAVALAGGTEIAPDNGKRGHLGASLIGKECWREIYYSWRWASDVKFDGRMLRLFGRGHHEEFRFVEWLELIGAKVQTRDEKTNRQIGFKSASGHFAGSTDGIATRVPGFDMKRLLLEMKTHNDKSFAFLQNNKIQKAKPVHYAQMVIYMDELTPDGGLYCAVNKNTDELYFEYVAPNPEYAIELRLKAEKIIASKNIPGRISNSPSWFGCRFCDFRLQCHYGQPLAINCRTCRMSAPVANGEWHCSKWNAIIPKDAQEKGCGAHMPIED